MADGRKSNRKPVSLNDSHYRLLQDLSAPPKPSFSRDEDGIEGGYHLSKASAAKTHQNFVSFNLEDDTDIPRFSGITDFGSSSEEKPAKVKIQGRRRLFKVSSRDEQKVVENEPEIADFDSPLPSKSMNSSHRDQGASEIRDILDDLSSRFDLLSVEKRKGIAKVADDLPKSVSGVVNGEKKIDLPEYASVGSSFFGASDSSSDTRKIFDGQINSVEDTHSEGVSFDNSKGDYFADKLHKNKDYGRRQSKNEYGRTDDNLVTAGDSFVSNIKDEEDKSDGVGESESESYVTRGWKNKESSQTLDKIDSKRVGERLRFVGRSHVSMSRDEEEEDEEGLILSGKKLGQEGGRCHGKHKEPSNRSSAIDMSNDTDPSVLVNDGSITLAGPRCTYKLTSKVAKMLFPHQRDGLKWLWSLHCQGKGGILGDDMGLGKTMQICSFLAGLFNSKLIKRALVVAPKTLLSHWIKELSTVGLSGETREYFGTSVKARQYELQYILQDKGILLTTYDIVRNNSKSLRGDGYYYGESEDDDTWDYMILDEGHLIKNSSTQRAKSLLEIPSAHRIIISGTPIQNNLKEMWTLFNFCCPDLLGDYKWFKETYEHKILRGNEKNASDREKHIGSTVAKELRERIQPYFLRRLKSEVFKEDNSTTATLSKKNEMIVWLRLTTCQRQLYEAFLKSELVLSAFDGSPLAALTILKKICDHPLLLTKRAAEDVLEGMDSMLSPEDADLAERLAMHVADEAERSDFEEKHDNISCKISFIMSLLDDLIPKGHNVLIFSQTRKMLNLIQESLASNGYRFLRIDGTTKASDRVKIVNDFQEGVGAPIFLLTSQVGGLGLTLTKADRVIVVDPAWNPSTDNQSVDRAYRIGQKKNVLVYRLMTCGTVEEKIYRKQIFKGGLFKTATEHKEQIRYFSQQDLRELFSLPKQGFDISLTQQQLHEEHGCQHKMDESLEAHIQFLETKGIAGVSHHSLLFSKAAAIKVVNIEEEETRRKGTRVYGNSSRHSVEQYDDGALHAFNPKDIKLEKKSSSPDSVGKLSESEIKEQIDRLAKLLGNKVTVSRLPDQGAKLEKQISLLNLELEKMKMENRTQKKDIIDLD